MPLRVALLGAGAIAGAHVPAIQHAAGVELVGVYDQDRARAETRAAGSALVYESWQALLDDRDVDCVAILLPHDAHEKFAIEALRAGKHVVCEKPLAPTVEACQQMLDAANRANRMLFPVHNRVYDRAGDRLGELVHGGAIGEVVLAQTQGWEGPGTVHVRPWLGTKAGGGGVLLAQAVHAAYMLRWLLGDVAQVGCLFGDLKVVEMTSEDTAVATLKFTSGALAEMTATFGVAHGPYDHSIHLHGRDGYIHLGSRQGGDGRTGNPYVLKVISPTTFADKELHEIELEPSLGFATGFSRMWADYAAAITEGSKPRVNGDDGLRAVEIIEAAYRSNANGQVVRLPLIPAIASN